jgi:hypothetical protein
MSAVASHSTSASQSFKLGSRVVSVASLSVANRDAMWLLFRQYYEDVSRVKFERDLAKKQDVILLFDTGDKTIRGFSTLMVFDREVEGKRVVAVFSGDTIVEKAYWGQTALHQAFTRYVLKQRLLHPFAAVYWFLITKGYRTYLLLSRTFPEYWPRHDKATPAWEKAVLDALATDMFGEAYHPQLGLLKFEVCEGRLKEGVSPIKPAMLKKPDIAFFVKMNPQHADGDELCCLGKVNAQFFYEFSSKLFSQAYRKVVSSITRPRLTPSVRPAPMPASAKVADVEIPPPSKLPSIALKAAERISITAMKSAQA